MAGPAIDKLLKKAQRMMKRGQNSAARKQLSIILRKDPDHLDGHYLLGTLLAESGQLDTAARHLERAHEIKPDSSRVLNNLANLRRQRGEHEAAMTAYQDAIRIDPNLRQAHLNLGSTLLAFGRHVEAVPHLLKATVLGPEDVDGWMQLGVAHTHLGRDDLAIDCFTNALEQDPTHVRVRRLLGAACSRVGDHDRAATLLAPLLDQGVSDPVDAHMLQAWAGQTPQTAAPEFVSALFDGMATGFDAHLMNGLKCRIPDAIRDAIDTVAPGRRFARLADLGCGTGLMGERLAARCDHLIGVDLSPKMLEQARQRGIYDELRLAAIDAWLASATQLDLLIAADVLIYVGELDALFAAARRASTPDALFAFSTERHDGDGVVLLPSGRFAHAPAYLNRLIDTHGFRVLHRSPENLRMERGDWVEGEVLVLASG